jgi:hypothetical protein
MEERIRILKAMGAGLVATVLMTAAISLAPYVGFPGDDYFSMLGSLLGTQAFGLESWNKIVGVIWHLNFGVIIFPHIYAYALYPILPGPPWLKGMSFGVGLWLFLELLVMPMVGAGVFSIHTAHTLYNVMGALVVHLLYGVTLGAVAGYVRVILPEMRQPISAVTGGPQEEMNGMPPDTDLNTGPPDHGSRLTG